MTETSATQALLVDAFGRVRELVADLTDGLGDDVARYRPEPQANTIAWLLWHLTRIQDDHLAGLTGGPQVWPRWRDRFGLPFPDHDTGYGHGPDDVAAVRVAAELLDGYQAEVHAETLDYVQTISDAELARVVDRRWDPPVTAAVRLVSVIGDALQHLGQAAYVRGLAHRAGLG